MFRFNQYELLMEVHHGMWSIVYHGRDTQTGREVAVKLKHDARHDVWTEHFQEADVILAFQHPNLVQVYDHGRSDDWYYVVTEWIQGSNLSHYLKMREDLPSWSEVSYPFDATRAVNFMRQVATGLGYAHAQGMIHGGIDCDQILFSSPRNVKLLPFSTTRVLRMDLTSPYAPEQTRHDRQITPATDIYTLGLLMYRMLTNRYPFEAETPGRLAKKHYYEAPVPPSQLNSTIPPELEALILRCLEKAPEKRYKDGSQLANALTHVLEGLG